MLERRFPHGGVIVREAVAMAAQKASREQSEALADRTGRAVVRELVAFLNSSRAPVEPEEG